MLKFSACFQSHKIGDFISYSFVPFIALIVGTGMNFNSALIANLYLSKCFAAASLTALFKHVGSTEERGAEEPSTWENVREKVLGFIKEKVIFL